MPPEKKTFDLPNEDKENQVSPLEDITNHLHNVKSLLTHGMDEISASYVAQRHLMPPVSTPGSANKYKTEHAKTYLHRVADLGFGHVERLGKRVLFRKRPFEELTQDARDTLNTMQVDGPSYKRRNTGISLTSM